MRCSTKRWYARTSRLLKKSLTRFPLPLRGEAETGKGPVDLFPAERAHMILVRTGREQDRVRGDKKQLDESWRYTLITAVSPSPPPSPIEGEGVFQQPARESLAADFRQIARHEPRT